MQLPLRLAEVAERLAGAEFSADLFLIVLVELLEIALDERRLHRTREDSIGTQSLGVFEGELAGHGKHRALACVVNQDVEATDMGDGLCNGVRTGHVEMDGLRGDSGFCEVFGSGYIDVGDPHEGAGADHLANRGCAGTTDATSDEGVAAVEAKGDTCGTLMGR